MSPRNFNPADTGYVEVDERIANFRARYPVGILQSRILELPEPFAGKFVAVEARAFRTPEDFLNGVCGVGLAWEPVPGTTPYTSNSELQNAETSAWGRALIAVLDADSKRGIASANEVRNRQDSGAVGRDPEPPSEAPRPVEDRATRSADSVTEGQEQGVPAEGGSKAGVAGEVAAPAEDKPVGYDKFTSLGELLALYGGDKGAVLKAAQAVDASVKSLPGIPPRLVMDLIRARQEAKVEAP